MADIIKCKNSIGGLKGRVTYYQNLLESDTQFSVGEYESMLDRIKTLYGKFDIAQSNLEDLDPTEITSNARDEFETRCRNVEAHIRDILREVTLNSVSDQNMSKLGASSSIDKPFSVPLPEIPLPKFDGSFLSWIEFREIYLHRIHKDCRLQSILKFVYLRECLRDGSAYHFIEGIPNSEENYNNVWGALFKHYDNEPRVRTLHMQLLYELKPVRNENNAAELKHFIDSFWKQFNALQALNVPVEHWDLFLVCHISRLLDSASRHQIEVKRPVDRDLTIKELMDILSDRARILEAMSPIIAKRSNIQPSTGKFQKPTHSLVLNAENRISCLFCKAAHVIYKCDKFISLSWMEKSQWVRNRRLCVNCFGSHNTYNCKSKFVCYKCKRRHHTLLHNSNFNSTQHVVSDQSVSSPPKEHKQQQNEDLHNSKPRLYDSNAKIHDIGFCNSTAENKSNPINSMPSKTMTALKPHNSLPVDSINYMKQTSSYHVSTSQVLLSTALIWVESSSGNRMQFRALLDSGSQSNFVTENVCQKLKANKRSISIPVSGISENVTEVKQQVDLSVASRDEKYKANLNFLVLPKITGDLPLHPVKFNLNTLSRHIQLADPKFFVPDRVDMLLGAEIYCDIFNGDRIEVCEELPPLQASVFGYVICGKVKNSIKTQSTSLFCCNVDEVRKEVQKFYCIEDVKPRNNFSLEEKACENHYASNVKRDLNGRYSVGLPTKSNIQNLENNKQNALKQFFQLEKKFIQNPELNRLYGQFIDEYISLNHMQLLKNTNIEPSYFLPHHAVMKESSTTTKLRVVFNASSKSSSGLSLNDCLMTGPTIQSDLLSLIMRFRKYPIALTADITKMYRQINVHDSDHKFQQIWWRQNSNEPLSVYQLKTVTYGTASAPFLAIRTLKQLAIDEHDNHPEASQLLLNDFYVDDFSSGSNNVKDAQQLKSNITSLLATGGFELTKWSSNNKQVVPEQKDLIVGVLGIQWDCEFDTINISLIKIDTEPVLKKRAILSVISQIFDPLGLCGPVVFMAKVFMQKLWSIPQLNWDDEITDPFKAEWLEFYNQLKDLKHVKVPRFVMSSQVKMGSIELHGFGDASQIGYGCCIYIRTRDLNDKYSISLLCAKSRVAPLKTQTIPRLELCASLLLAQLYEKVQESIQIKFDKVTLWTDSEITLHRIRSSPSKYATFVANRVSQIQDIASPELWAYVPSELNPADIISRGLMPSQLKKSGLWWNGPSFLSQNDEYWTIPKFGLDNPDIEDVECSKSKTLVGVLETSNRFLELFSNYDKLVRIAALCLRFARNTKLSIQKRNFGPLSSKEIDDGLKGMIKFIQKQMYSQEIKQLQYSKLIHKQSSIVSLNPFIDSEGILRVGGRLNNSSLPYDQKHPILISSNNPLSVLIGHKEHIRNLHAGPQALHCTLRQRFWIIGGRTLCRKIVHDCILCFRIRPRSITQIMGQLPAERVRPSRAFQNVGIDFCGPFAISYKIRTKVESKVYIAVFICFATKATHFEIVSDLTTPGFLAALRRFISRRGRPSNIFSDNATNFIGAKSELRELQKLFENELHQHNVLKYCVQEGMQWNTIPPRSPHFGGLWEAAVKSAKFHLKRIMSYSCTFEELNTLIIQVEACLNSRPLTALSNDPNDLSALTPGHFLIGSAMNSIPEPTLFHLDFNRLARYQRLQYSLQQFWHRWSNEYLSDLQKRNKWTQRTSNIQIGNLVLLKDENLPPMKWAMGRVIQLHPGSDGLVRVVTVKAASSEFKRAITKVCVLPVETQTKIDKSSSENI